VRQRTKQRAPYAQTTHDNTCEQHARHAQTMRDEADEQHARQARTTRDDTRKIARKTDALRVARITRQRGCDGAACNG
jgi:hypothetical protein